MRHAWASAVVLATLGASVSAWAQSSPPADPIVERRMNDRQANRDYRERVSDAKRDARLERKVNKETAAAAADAGRDPIVEHRMLDRQTRKELRQEKREARTERRTEKRENAERATEAMSARQ